MPDFSQRSHQPELMDDLTLASDDLRRNLRELEITNRLLGGNGVTLRGIDELLNSQFSIFNAQFTIADLGCGGGDMLRLMARWLRKKNLRAMLTGLDANAFMLRYAGQHTQTFPEIQYQQLDVFSEEFRLLSFDVVTMTLFCHHFNEEQLVDLFTTLRRQTRLGIVINDLHRHPLAYYSIWLIAKLLRTSYLYQHDSRLSVLRAFRRAELEILLRRAGFTRYQIRWRWAFRWEVVAWCQEVRQETKTIRPR
ncbi:MAG: methyltransferase domain-containing protein [Cytophagaceae bacterium]|nr:methyltransferase domain-containing protein [Cytophagaceae bacterium]